MNYIDKLKDPHWQKKRLEIFKRDNFTCQYCQSKDKQLHVHHRYYVYKNDPWDYPNDALLTLCIDCHEEDECYKDDSSELLRTIKRYGFSNYDISKLETIFSYELHKVSEGKERLKPAHIIRIIELYFDSGEMQTTIENLIKDEENNIFL